MRAIRVDRWMEPAELRVSEIPEPEGRAGCAAGGGVRGGLQFLRHPDRAGPIPGQTRLSLYAGWGDIGRGSRAVGEGVEGFAVGDRVLAGTQIGGFRGVRGRSLRVVPTCFPMGCLSKRAPRYRSSIRRAMRR